MKILQIDLNGEGKDIRSFSLHESIEIERLSKVNYDIDRPMVFELENGCLILPPVIWANAIITITL